MLLRIMDVPLILSRLISDQVGYIIIVARHINKFHLMGHDSRCCRLKEVFILGVYYQEGERCL
ncbi:hypothetical protein DVH26_07105 [Paenibacillus sp. H1-7]|nr:hypothetical protein DVH26_07105 [Paenibacillus sp. H1-7]